MNFKAQFVDTPPQPFKGSPKRASKLLDNSHTKRFTKETSPEDLKAVFFCQLDSVRGIRKSLSCLSE